MISAMELPPGPKCCQDYLKAYIAANLERARNTPSPRKAAASRRNGKKGGRPPGRRNKVKKVPKVVVTSERKAAAARLNGLKGGRPTATPRTARVVDAPAGP